MGHSFIPLGPAKLVGDLKGSQFFESPLCSRTEAAVGGGGPLLQNRGKTALAAVAHGDSDIPAQPIEARAPHRGTIELLLELLLVQAA
jgi:hypothetical protein